MRLRGTMKSRAPRGELTRGCAQYIAGLLGGRTYSFGFLTSTLGKVTSFFSVPTVGTLIVSLTVPVSMLGVFTVSVSVPTTGFWTSYCPSPVFLQALSVSKRSESDNQRELIHERPPQERPITALEIRGLIWLRSPRGGGVADHSPAQWPWPCLVDAEDLVFLKCR